MRARAFLGDTTSPASAYREFTQHFPRPGWVEHDADEIWNAVVATLTEVIAALGARDIPIAAIGITNQRETIVAWDRATDAPLARAIVWQDRRTADRCTELAPHLDMVRHTTGLVLDPYFSASKIEWLVRHGGVSPSASTAFGTIDSWLIWRLSGGRAFVTDSTNASRTMLFDIRANRWSDDLCDLFGVSTDHLPRVVPSSGRCAVTAAVGGIPAGIPISGIAGDQQAALFGQGCFAPGAAKNTYGTGSFLLLNAGTTAPPPHDGLLTTIAWQLGDDPVVYALEGAIFSTGSTVQWLRDELGIISASSDLAPLAATVPDAGGVVVVPAFAGLGSPWWDADARGTILGLSAGVSRAHIARAVVDSMVMQTRDVVAAMNTASGVALRELRVDGGAAAMDLMLQLQADALGVDVVRPSVIESTATGAAMLAGLAEGVWSLDDLARLGETHGVGTARGVDSSRGVNSEQRFHPRPDNPGGLPSTDVWLRAVERSRAWVHRH